MKTVRIKNLFKKSYIFEVYETPQEMPMDKFLELSKLQIVESGIGDNIHDIGTRFAKMYKYIEAKALDKVLKEARNLHNTFYFSLTEHPKLTARQMLCYTHTINSQVVSMENMDKYLGVIDKLPQGEVMTLHEEVKKKWMSHYEPLFLIQEMNSNKSRISHFSEIKQTSKAS